MYNNVVVKKLCKHASLSGSIQSEDLSLELDSGLTSTPTTKCDSNHIIKFVDDTTPVGLVCNDDETCVQR